MSCEMSHALCKPLTAIVDRSSIMNGLGRCIFFPFAFKSMSLGKEFPGAVKSDMERPSDSVVLLQIGTVFSASIYSNYKSPLNTGLSIVRK